MNAIHDENVIMGTFWLGEQEFGVDILQQREVLRMMPITKVPCSVDFIDGVINLRASIIPIVNLRARFGMPRVEFSKSTRILTLEVTDSLIVGFIVDSVGQIRRVNTASIEPPPVVLSSVDSGYIKGVGKFEDSLLIILDIAKVFSPDDIDSLEQLG